MQLDLSENAESIRRYKVTVSWMYVSLVCLSSGLAWRRWPPVLQARSRVVCGVALFIALHGIAFGMLAELCTTFFRIRDQGLHVLLVHGSASVAMTATLLVANICVLKDQVVYLYCAVPFVVAVSIVFWENVV